MVGVIMLALGVPIAAILLSVNIAYKRPEPVESTAALNEGLRAALTEASEKSLPSSSLDEGKSRLLLQSGNFEASQKNLSDLAARCQGVAVIFEPGVLLIHVPETANMDAFLKELRSEHGPDIQTEKIVPQATLLEIALKPTS